eukprot:GGOE01019200.1.p1 GENE.GGOE01019200.1~~GGOE01019200.1.p1  ORF type:complete len:310 (+),score=36.07 GGOE01019200.1:81-932(+)
MQTGILPRIVNITVYHTTLESSGFLPLDQDTADFFGAMFFGTTAAFTQASCRLDPSSWWCENPEVFTPTDRLVVTELILEVDSRFGPYGKCNVCLHIPGQYICNCLPGSTFGQWTAAPDLGEPDPAEWCGTAVGHENIGIDFVPCCTPSSSQDDCWFHNMARKIGGNWYSTFSKGYCPSFGAPHCTWRVAQIVQRIHKRCADDIIFTGVEQRNVPCFQRCGPHRNVTSVCWQRCFMATVVGPHADHLPDISGLPIEQLAELWSRPLRAEGAGGCPKLPTPTVA